ncbi:MAG: hypothetical protein ACFFB9_05595 [Promethearchaeota archaeon]
MDLARFLQIYVVQELIALFFLYMAYLILTRGRKTLNVYLSCFYLSTTIGGIINMIYANIFNETIVFIMHFLTYYLFCLSMIFLLIFALNLPKHEKKITFKYQILFQIILGLLILGLLFIPNGIVINVSTNWKPDWD